MIPITIESMLRDQASNVYSPTATALRNKLESRLTVGQSLVIILCAKEANVNTDDFKSARSALLKSGHIYGAPGTVMAPNRKILKIYRLTDKGEAEHAEILAAYGPLVERINKSREATASA